MLFTSSFQAMLSTGALLGGLVVDAWSVSVAMVCGGVCALLTTGVLLWSRTGDVASRDDQDGEGPVPWGSDGPRGG
ncbi:hypothetical protein EV646_110327 [Kribbella antiqua]|uniref:Uncharacterized protein n=1 Tax=Kribbella antiqua TaxID=2512217 RepID=A0A4R2IJS7_9ACTN|nr:hypothetical protein EV646_110327 [Kribbella antiqua]